MKDFILLSLVLMYSNLVYSRFTYWVHESCPTDTAQTFILAILGAQDLAIRAHNRLRSFRDDYTRDIFQRIFKVDINSSNEQDQEAVNQVLSKRI